MKHARTDYDERIQDSAGLIPEDEPVLLIRGQDVCAVPALDEWVRVARDVGTDEKVIESVLRHRTRVIVWQDEHLAKTPDAPESVLT